MPDLSVPDMNTLVEGAAGKVPAVRAKGNAVHGLLVASQCVDTHPTLHVPQAHCWVKWCATEMEWEGSEHESCCNKINHYVPQSWDTAFEVDSCERKQPDYLDMHEYCVYLNTNVNKNLLFMFIYCLIIWEGILVGWFDVFQICFYLLLLDWQTLSQLHAVDGIVRVVELKMHTLTCWMLWVWFYKMGTVLLAQVVGLCTLIYTCFNCQRDPRECILWTQYVRQGREPSHSIR